MKKAFMSLKFHDGDEDKKKIEDLTNALLKADIENVVMARDVEKYGQANLPKGAKLMTDYAFPAMKKCDMLIVEFSAKGVGLGLAFLKHLERSRILIYVIDMAGTDNREPWKDYEILLKEITEYSSELAERPAIVVANKMDEPQSEENLRRFI